jgi:hypothetical protein
LKDSQQSPQSFSDSRFHLYNSGNISSQTAFHTTDISFMTPLI